MVVVGGPWELTIDCTVSAGVATQWAVNARLYSCYVALDLVLVQTTQTNKIIGRATIEYSGGVG
jgi:hypothetical protein